MKKKVSIEYPKGGISKQIYEFIFEIHERDAINIQCWSENAEKSAYAIFYAGKCQSNRKPSNSLEIEIIPQKNDLVYALVNDWINEEDQEIQEYIMNDYKIMYGYTDKKLYIKHYGVISGSSVADLVISHWVVCFLKSQIKGGRFREKMIDGTLYSNVNIDEIIREMYFSKPAIEVVKDEKSPV
jgi:hypothetical protein